MTTEDLHTLIWREVADAPPLRTTGAQVVAAGRLALRRRRLIGGGLAGGLAAALTAAGLALPGWPTLLDRGRDTGEVPPAGQRTLDDFNPETFPGIVDTVVRGAAGDALPADVVGRIEPTLDGSIRLRPADYAYTDAWTARYDLSAHDRLTVILRQDASANEGSAEEYCRQNLADGSMERCSVATLADGSIAITSVVELRRTPAGFVSTPGDDPDTRWFSRQVVNRRDDGFGVIARETVKASTLAGADAQWSVPTPALVEIAGSPTLVYRLPTDPTRDCDVTFLPPETEDGYARVVCEGSLND